MLKVGKNKYQVDNISSEGMEEILRLYCKERNCKNKVFVRLIINAAKQIDESKLRN